MKKLYKNMNTFFAKLLTLVIKDKSKKDAIYNILTNKERSCIKQEYFICGDDNKILLVDQNNEKLLDKTSIIKGLNIKINGKNNTIKIDSSAVFKNSEIIINNDNVNIQIGSDCLLKNLSIRCSYGDKQYIKIGNNVTIYGAKLICDEVSGIIIGDNCLFSNSISIWAADGHSIIDNKGNVLNRPQNYVQIGKHCWIGEGAKLTKNCKIAENSVVGAYSVVVKNYDESNVIIAGNPAQIIKKEINWVEKNTYNYQKQNNYILEGINDLES